MNRTMAIKAAIPRSLGTTEIERIVKDQGGQGYFC